MDGTVVVCLGFKDWYADHLARCLDTLTQIRLPVVLTDLGSREGARAEIRTIVQRYPHVTLIEADADAWSRSRALNLAATAAPNAETLVFTDADMLFPSRWAWALHWNLSRPGGKDTLWLTDSRDLPPLYAIMPPEGNWWRNAGWLHRMSTPHTRLGQGAGMVVPRRWFEKVGGFDEFYITWGCEDNDLCLRAEWDGLPVEWLGPPESAWVCHQHHRRDWPTAEQVTHVQRNRSYLAERIAEQGPVVRNTMRPSEVKPQS
jgi:GT2 family glycosyltransferase